MMKLALFLTITLIDMNVVLSYEMGRNNNTFCPERHSCRYWNDRRYCKCDSLCEAYDDCCDDYRRSGWSSNWGYNNAFYQLHNVIGCKQLFRDSNDFHYAVERCPNWWRQDQVRAKCRSPEWYSEDTITKVPVVGRRTSILYRNVYCAVCSGERDVVFSKGYVEGNSEQVDLNRMEFLYPEGYNLRTCINAIRTCNSYYRNHEVNRRCSGPAQSNSFVNSGSGLEFMPPDTTFYRNADCARCNFVNEPKQMCNYQVTHHTGYGHFIPPFTKIIDFSRNTVQIINKQNGRSNTATFPCPGRRVYDPKSNTCRIVFSN